MWRHDVIQRRHVTSWRHTVTSRDVMTSSCDVTWRHDVILWCHHMMSWQHMMSHHNYVMFLGLPCKHHDIIGWCHMTSGMMSWHHMMSHHRPQCFWGSPLCTMVRNADQWYTTQVDGAQHSSVTCCSGAQCRLHKSTHMHTDSYDSIALTTAEWGKKEANFKYRKWAKEEHPFGSRVHNISRGEILPLVVL